MNDESILLSIKKMLGYNEDYKAFDMDIIIGINSALSMLSQIGVGPDDGFTITGQEETWDMLLGDRKDLEDVKTYIYITTKSIHDPPTNSSILNSLEKIRDECAWRIQVQSEVNSNGWLYSALWN